MWRVLDMSLTAHSRLRDRYRRRALTLTLVTMALSIAATSVAFLAGGGALGAGFLTLPWPVWVGMVSAAIFFLSVAELVVDWRQRSWGHREAALRLSELKGRFRAATVQGDRVDTAGVDLQSMFESVLASPPQIPENKFVAMKAKHHRKVALSKLIDTHKGAPVAYLRLLIMLRGMQGEKAEGSNDSRTGESIEGPPA
jgi:hypothetical protein